MPHPASLPALVLLVRHGATEWSVSGQHTGRTDLSLTEKGVAQAMAVGPLIEELLEGRHPLVYTSPLERAARTAELALPHRAAEPLDVLMEFDYGNYEGLTSSQIIEMDPLWDLFATGCPGGESTMQVSARCDSFVAKVEREGAGRAVVAFTHGHLSRILTARMLNLAAAGGASLWNDTASVGVINEHRGRLVLVGWNLCAY
ncbi:MAG: histidine phosphatase family protein [Ilumatobacteraceae bacterium]|nr:histidine phosphatase family protein [Ilumatobacteraceae bacterium]